MTFHSPTPNPDSIRAQGIERLAALVGDGVVLYLAAQDAHWNVKAMRGVLRNYHLDRVLCAAGMRRAA